MQALTAEWIDKAEGDFATATREVRARKNPNFDATCFHAQQMTEKYLKAILHENQQHIPKIQNLLKILDLCLPFESSLLQFQDALAQLDRYSIQFHYPGESADKDEAHEAYIYAKEFRIFMRALPIFNS